jgi:hypothetical protein
MLETKKKSLFKKNRTNRSNPNCIGLIWFGSDFILKVNRTKPIRILFYLTVRMTFTLKTEPNRTANTPSSDTSTFADPIFSYK